MDPSFSPLSYNMNESNSVALMFFYPNLLQLLPHYALQGFTTVMSGPAYHGCCLLVQVNSLADMDSDM